MSLLARARPGAATPPFDSLGVPEVRSSGKARAGGVRDTGLSAPSFATGLLGGSGALSSGSVSAPGSAAVALSASASAPPLASLVVAAPSRFTDKGAKAFSRAAPALGLRAQESLAQLALGESSSQSSQAPSAWRCTLCTKVNEAASLRCACCKRARGHLASDQYLPFHPPYANLEGAARFLDYRKIEAFLQAGVDGAQTDSQGWTGLHWATALSRLDLVELYLAHGVSVDVARTSDGFTPLHVAAQMGDHEVLLHLLNRGADPDARCLHEGRTPLHVACRENHPACVEALGMAGADVNAAACHTAFTPLHVAALAGSYESARSLVLVAEDPLRVWHGELCGLDYNAVDVDGWTPYNIAMLRKHEDIAALIHRKLGMGAGRRGEVGGAKEIADYQNY